jgi:GTPase SAR1 family protein
MTKEAEKKYCIIMLDTSVFLDLADQIYDAWRNSKTSETPMDKDTRRMLEDMFDEDRTYTSCYDASHIDRLFECYKRWSYDFRIDIFPLCNVIHNGHIEFFPSLLSATQFNFTIIAISTEYKHVEESLNNEGKQLLTWRKYSRSMFYASDIDESDVGIVICIPEKDIPWICEILDSRRQKNNRIPLIINIQVSDLKDADQIIGNVKSQLRCWNELSKDLTDHDLDDLIVVQTPEQSSRPIESGILENASVEGSECWRVLISAEEYQDMLLSLLRNPDKLHQAQWLFCQLPMSNENSFQEDRRILESDDSLKELFDREAFRCRKYKWEVEGNV